MTISLLGIQGGCTKNFSFCHDQDYAASGLGREQGE